MGLRARLARRASPGWAAELAGTDGRLVPDPQTTGIGPDAEVLQVPVVHPPGTTLLEAWARPAQPIPPAATAIYGLTDPIVGAALPYPAVHGPL